MNKEPYMPLFVGDFLAATLFWKGEEKALYLLLLAYQWASGPLPKSPAEIAEAVGYELKHFTRLWAKVGQKFESTNQGLINHRLEVVRAKAREVSTKRARAGQKGGEANRKQMDDGLLKQNASKPEANGSAKRKQADERLYSHPIQSNPIQEEEAYQGEEGCH